MSRLTRAGDLLRAIRTRVRAMLRPADADAEMADEIRFHLEMEARKLEAAGLAPAAAMRQARVAFGGVEAFKDEVRTDRGFRWMGEAGRDIRFALRGIRRTPGFALLAVVTLALGIGAATTIFALVDATLLRRLPYHQAERLVHIWETNPEGSDFSTSEPTYLDFRDRNTTLSSISAYRPEQLALTGRGDPQSLTGGAASASLFSTLGVAPVVGRTFGPDEDTAGSPARVVVISHALWHRSFGGDSAVAGATAVLRGEPYKVIGVLPADFDLIGADAWIPLGANPARDRDDHWLGMIGRMKPGVEAELVSADLARITTENLELNPYLEGWGVRALSLTEFTVGADLQRTSVMLAAAVGVLLLLACANVANLLLARASSRETELTIRIAMGAGRGRLIRQLLVESGTLAVMGAMLGLVGVRWAVAAASQLPPGLLRGLDGLRISPRVLLFSLGVTVVTALVAGLAPAVGASRVDLHSSLKRAGRSGSASGSHRIRDLLVVGQVSLAVLLLIGGGLMIRSVARLGQADIGMTTEHVWSVPLPVPPSRYPAEWQVARFYNVVASRLAAVPGIAAVGATAVEPFSGNNLVNDVTPEELAADHPSAGYLQAVWRVVTPGYFEAAGVPLLLGRDFASSDLDSGTDVAIVSRSLADRLWPGEEAVGKRLFWGGTDGTPRTVVGVVGDLSDVAVERERTPTLFLSTWQLAWPKMTLIVRAEREMPGIAEVVRQAVWAEDALLPVPVVRPLAESRAQATATPRLGAVILGAFGATALVLALVGLYGVLSYAVVERTREIGIRMALGAQRTTVLGWLVGRGMRLAVSGVTIGLVAALLLAPLMEAMLYQTAPADLSVLIIVSLLLVGVAALAAFIPGWRATRIDPAEAFRAE